MLRSYLKLALRNISRKKLYSVIHLTGLGVASAFCILVYWYVQHERSFDRFHTNSDRLYRLESTDLFRSDPIHKSDKEKSFFFFLIEDAEQQNTLQTPVILAGALEKTFPEIEHAVRIAKAGSLIVRVNNQAFKETENAAYVDKEFFEVFDYPLLQGNPLSVLSGRNQIVLSEKTAVKYFGKENPMGKTVLLPSEDSALYTVSGVAKNFPSNSSFRFDLMIPRESQAGYAKKEERGLNTSSDLLVIQLRKNTDVDAFSQKLDAFGKQYYGPTLREWAAASPESHIKPEAFRLLLRPFAKAHYNKSSGWPHYTDLKNIYQLACLAVVILVIACLNYILLTLTGTVSRSQEVGVRKTVGAGRKHIIFQFFIETQMLAFFAVLAGFLLANLCLPFFSSLIGSDLALRNLSFKEVIPFLLTLAVVLSLLAGLYPALVMSGLKPLNMMRKLTVYRLNPYVSRLLVVTQFSVCVILIISSLVISRQIRYMNEKDLGFDKEQVIAIENPYGFGDLDQIGLLKERLQHYASSAPFIEDFTGTTTPYGSYESNGHIINGERLFVQLLKVDYDYFSFFKIPMVKGRSFSPHIPGDSAQLELTDAQKLPGGSSARQAVVVNETLYKILGKPPIGDINREIGGPIIGVCQDYHVDDLTKKIAPAYHRIERKFILTFWIKIKAGQPIPEALDKIRAAWNDLTDNQPFSYTFLDEDVAKNYEAYLRWMRTVTAACLLAIIIACMGLFGLSGLIAISRTKEIGIRKVLGATVSDLFLLLNKGTLIMALISFAVALPIATYLVNQWLQNFAYRIHPGWMLFALAGVLSLLTALMAVSYHTIKTAKANPVKSLRTE